jgi:hydroxypyruvate isomerase
MNRRSAMKNMTSLAAAAFVTESVGNRLEAANTQLDTFTKGKINHSACRWCYNGVSLDDLCKRGKEVGLQALDLLNLDEVPTAQKYGLTCSMVNFNLKGYGISRIWWNILKPLFQKPLNWV